MKKITSWLECQYNLTRYGINLCLETVRDIGINIGRALYLVVFIPFNIFAHISIAFEERRERLRSEEMIAELDEQKKKEEAKTPNLEKSIWNTEQSFFVKEFAELQRRMSKVNSLPETALYSDIMDAIIARDDSRRESLPRAIFSIPDNIHIDILEAGTGGRNHASSLPRFKHPESIISQDFLDSIGDTIVRNLKEFCAVNDCDPDDVMLSYSPTRIVDDHAIGFSWTMKMRKHEDLEKKPIMVGDIVIINDEYSHVDGMAGKVVEIFKAEIEDETVLMYKVMVSLARDRQYLYLGSGEKLTRSY